MTELDKVRADRISAMKRRDKATSSILGVLIADVERKQDPSKECIVKVAKAIINSNRESLASVDAGSFEAQKLNLEIQVLEKYLPTNVLTGIDLRIAIELLVSQIDNPSMRNLKDIIASIKATGSDYDGNEVRTLFSEIIATKVT